MKCHRAFSCEKKRLQALKICPGDVLCLYKPYFGVLTTCTRVFGGDLTSAHRLPLQHRSLPAEQIEVRPMHVHRYYCTAIVSRATTEAVYARATHKTWCRIFHESPDNERKGSPVDKKRYTMTKEGPWAKTGTRQEGERDLQGKQTPECDPKRPPVRIYDPSITHHPLTDG